MTPETKKRIHLIYGIVLVAVTIIAGLCLMYGCYRIYTDGLAADNGQIYSREIVAAAFAGIAVPVYLCLALVIGSFILHVALPLPEKKVAPEKNYPLILQRLREKKDFAEAQTDLRTAAEHQRKLRRLHCIISLALIAVCTAVFLIFACRGSYWPEVNDPDRNVTDAVIGIMPLLAACVLIPMAYTVFTACFCRISMQKEIALMKQATGAAEGTTAVSFRISSRTLLIIRCALAVLAVAGIVIGASTGGVEAIIAKAVAICTECIGLG